MDFKQIVEDLIKLPAPELLINGEINGDKYGMIAGALCYLKTKGSPPLLVTIDSGGGDVDPGLDIHDLLRLYPGETTGRVIGRAASMACVILQACNKRHCAIQAGVLIHHVSRKNVSLDVLTSKHRLRNLITDMKKNQSRIYKILCEKTGKSLREIVKECKKDQYMTADEAKQFGLVDEVI